MTPAPTEQHYRILLVEDDSGDALLVQELLTDTSLPPTPSSGTRRSPRPAPNWVCGRWIASGWTSTCPTQPVCYAVHRKHAERASADLRADRMRAEENARLERGLLPQPMLGTSPVTVVSRYHPGRDNPLLGGDFLDAVETNDGQLHAIVGDVSGHDPDAAALGVCLRIAWRALTLGGHRGNELLRQLEHLLVAERAHPDLFATCTLLTLDSHAHKATLHLAGHHEPLLTTSTGTQEVSASHGIALGIADGLNHWPATDLTLPPTGALTLYTDGLVEGLRLGSSERLGIDGLLTPDRRRHHPQRAPAHRRRRSPPPRLEHTSNAR
ncbi:MULTISPECIES: PP2C family protein-serine/threonine phosphatase [unclassified Streptomyces]|uniref:PP2C family protein-serine/threonine phosphatase n=1 Tax=Streptomyces sp. SID8377 TaxID=2690357 RepID=UPI0003A5DDEA|nr:PP2C family protein-serine/threonine phosphatase [Streptomyces sp. BoleA5]